jgi:hypothetical protein
MARLRILWLAVPLALAACGPVSPEVAARRCEEEAREAKGLTGYVYGGVDENGPAGGGSVSISTDYIARKDPQMVYDNCVRRMTGQGAIRPPDLDTPTKHRVGH